MSRTIGPSAGQRVKSAVTGARVGSSLNILSGGSSSAAATGETEAQQQFDRLTAATNEEQLGQRLAMMKVAADNEPAFVSQLASVIAGNEYAWLALMQRIFNDAGGEESDKRKAAMVSLVCSVAVKEDVRPTLLATKLSSVLTVAGPTLPRAVRCVLACLGTPHDVESFLMRMQGFDNVATCLDFAPLDQAAALIANLVGKANSTAKPMAEHGIDTKLLRVAFKALSEISQQLPAFSMTLYALRFFGRAKVNDFDFAERCLSLCAHTVRHVPQPAGELAADVCQLTSSTAFTKSHPNLLANLFFCCPALRATCSRKVPIAAFIARAITAHDKGEMAAAALKAYKAISALVDVWHDGPSQTPAPLELITSLLHATQCVLRCTPPRYASVQLDYIQLAACRSVLMLTDHKNALFAGTIERWLSITWTLRQHAFCASLKQLLDPWSTLVAQQHATPELYTRVTGNVYNLDAVAGDDAEIEDRLDACVAPLVDLAEECSTQRSAAFEAETVSRQKIAKHFSDELDGLVASPRQQYFNAVVLPGCRHLTATHTESVTMKATTAAEVLIDPLKTPELQPMLERQAATAHAVAASASGAEATVERIALPLIHGIECAARANRVTWQNKQAACLWRAKAGLAVVRRSDPHVFNLLLLELEEEVARGTGWHGLPRSAQTNASASLKALVLKEEEAREVIMSQFRDGPGHGHLHTEMSMYSPRVTPAGASWRLPRQVAGPGAGNMASITAIEDANFDEWLQRFQSGDVVKDAVREEVATRQCIVADALSCVALTLLCKQETEARWTVTAAFEQFTAVAVIALSSPHALAMVLRENVF
jgi:hypothetical protein